MRHTQVTRHVTVHKKLPSVPVCFFLENALGGYPWGRDESASEVTFIPLPETPEQVEEREKRGPVETVEVGPVLKEFLKVDTEEQALAFLRKYGNSCCSWLYDDSFPRRLFPAASWVFPDGDIGLDSVSFHDLCRYRDLLKMAAEKPLTEWFDLEVEFGISLASAATINVQFDEGVLVGVIRSENAALLFSQWLWVEKADGAEFRLCERRSCKSLFRIESQLGKKYCSPRCAHAAAVHASRKRKTNEKLTNEKPSRKLRDGKAASRRKR